jgi:hypothetical protein
MSSYSQPGNIKPQITGFLAGDSDLRSVAVNSLRAICIAIFIIILTGIYSLILGKTKTRLNKTGFTVSSAGTMPPLTRLYRELYSETSLIIKKGRSDNEKRNYVYIIPVKHDRNILNRLK